MHNKSTPSSSCPKLDLISCLPLNESTISLFDSYRNKFGPSEIELNQRRYLPSFNIIKHRKYLKILIFKEIYIKVCIKN
jgi:hypothetical protein